MFTLDHALFSIEEGLARARRFVGTDSDWRRTALAYDRYLTRDGERRDAVCVLAWDREMATAVSVAHRYVPGQTDRPLERIGDPLYLGAAPPPGA